MTKPKEVIGDWLDRIEQDGRGLSKWEEDFVESVAEQFINTGSISDRQEQILECIYAEKTPL